MERMMPKITGSQRAGRFSALVLAAVALGSSPGCTRAFFRHWADQDVSEAVFEKSRDPRWRIDMYSIEPPMMSRYAEPYDPDHPPAPPDDYATQALSPVPQWSQKRLLVPSEGTGYEEMLIRWQMKRDAEKQANPGSDPAAGVAPPGSVEREGPAAPGDIDPEELKARQRNRPVNPPAPPRPNEPSPLQRPGNSGTNPSSPTQSNNARLSRDRNGAKVVRDAIAKIRESQRRYEMLLEAYKETGLPAPKFDAATIPVSYLSQNPGAGEAQPPTVPRPRTGIPNDPNPNVDVDQVIRGSGRRAGQSEAEYRQIEETTSEFAAILSPEKIELDDSEVAGLPESTRPYLIDLEQAFHLAVTNGRYYQFQLENLYQAALSVTLQRFAFQPQFYAGLSPTTGAINSGFPGTNPSNVFTYRTKYAPGGQLSALNMGAVAGVGKLFSTGGQLLAGFANQLVFNFVGKTPIQPTVQSSLPLTFVQPLLAGGGRAVTLEALTNAERNLLYQIRLFARFRQELFTSITVGTSITNPGLFDPDPGFILVLQALQQVENSGYNLAAFERALPVFSDLANGPDTGITPLQVDQMRNSVISARLTLYNARLNYRNALDQMKVQLGLPPDVTLSLDRSLIIGFKDSFDKLYKWAADPKRLLDDLPGLVSQLPELKDMEIDGRPVIKTLVSDPAQFFLTKDAYSEQKLEDLLVAGERVALENRVDLMNARAQLYDAWRQIRVTSNALKGVLNVALTNQYITPTNNTNPFGFLDQAKQFSLVLNTELPLVRLSQRNNYRSAWINYQRQRRTLMNAEDNVKYGIRNEIRTLQVNWITYEINKQLFLLAMRQKDQALEQIVAPPQPGNSNATALVAAQTSNFIQFQSSLLGSQNTLISTWVAYELYRLQLYRDLGIMPYDEWEALYELFPPRSVNRRDGGQPPAAGA